MPIALRGNDFMHRLLRRSVVPGSALRVTFISQADYLIRRFCRLDECQCDLGLKENGQHRKRNRPATVAMEAPIEKLTPLRVLKQVQMLRG